jgi:hypothetical protein
MPDRSDEFRRAALECLQLARATTDEGSRAPLLIYRNGTCRITLSVSGPMERS